MESFELWIHKRECGVFIVILKATLYFSTWRNSVPRSDAVLSFLMRWHPGLTCLYFRFRWRGGEAFILRKSMGLVIEMAPHKRWAQGVEPPPHGVRLPFQNKGHKTLLGLISKVQMRSFRDGVPRPHRCHVRYLNCAIQNWLRVIQFCQENWPRWAEGTFTKAVKHHLGKRWWDFKTEIWDTIKHSGAQQYKDQKYPSFWMFLIICKQLQEHKMGSSAVKGKGGGGRHRHLQAAPLHSARWPNKCVSSA